MEVRLYYIQVSSRIVRTFTFYGFVHLRLICWYLVKDIDEERKDNSGAKS